jgi:predicted GIY-YIG superfamily endonuclease
MKIQSPHRNNGRVFCYVLTVVFLVVGWSRVSVADDEKAAAVRLGFPTKRTAAETRQLKDVVRLAYADVYDGWSTDEVLLQDELNKSFIAACKKRLPRGRSFDFNWTLLNLRKAGQLSDLKSTRRKPIRHDDYLHSAEIAARFLEDKYEVNTDRIICEPKLRAEFDAIAKKTGADVAAYRLRKASFTLRKSRRLQPELVSRVANWNKKVVELDAAKIVADSALVPSQPGVYIIRDKSGYLYIGESSDLRKRISKHLDESDRKSLAGYLKEQGIKSITVEVHSFDSTSDARLKPMRRAYESDLIRSRKPRFNLAP